MVLNGLFQGGVYSLIATSLTLLYGTLKIVNFAHGDFLMLSMYATFWLFDLFGLDPLISLGITIPLFYVLGYLIEKGLVKRTLEAPRVSQVLMTLGLSIILQNLIIFLWTADFKRVEVPYGDMFVRFSGIVIEVPKAMIFFVSVTVCTAFYIILKKTYIGAAIRAVSQDRETADVLGIDSNEIYAIVFGLGLVLVSIAGSLLITYFPVHPFLGSTYMLMAFVIVTLGGLGNYVGTLISGFVIGIVESISAFYFLSPLRYVTLLLMFLLVLLLRPEGVFVRSSGR